MTLDKDLFDLVVARAGLQPNRDVFRGPLPEDAPRTCCALIYRGGTAEVDGRVAEADFQLYVVGETQDKALSLYLKVRNALLGTYQLPFGDSRTLFSVTETSRGILGLDETGRFAFSANFAVRTEHVV